MHPGGWDDRIARAETLRRQYPSVAETLSFYLRLLRFQKHLSALLAPQLAGRKPSCLRNPRFAGEDLSLLLSFFSSFLDLVHRAGAPDLSRAAQRLREDGTAAWEELLCRYWSGELTPESCEDPPFWFFPKAFLQPYASLLRPEIATGAVESRGEGLRQQGRASCPACGRLPQLGILAAEGEGARRSLMCSLCGAEWRYKRISCPACGEEDFARLHYSRASDFPHVRVDLCQSCHKYIKSIDLTVDGRAVPPVDEMASLPLDLWAVEQGFSKIELNLAGI